MQVVNYDLPVKGLYVSNGRGMLDDPRNPPDMDTYLHRVG